MSSEEPPSVRNLLRDEDLQRGIDESGIGMWDLDLETGGLFWSSATRRLFRISQTDPVNYELFLSLLQPEDRIRADQAIQRSIETGCKL
ncbi:MAG: PAS domain-containing protein, partial [Rhizobiales bacterium]|nr:PAS domain-containing protein [Hyphomicrobiales bacterium]